MKIILENVRTFSGKSTFPLKPLTIVTGENSSGKTSFLAAAAALFNSPGFPLDPDFNEPPFVMGGYDTIATFKGGRAGRARTFSIGYEVDGNQDDLAISELLATYENDHGRPAMCGLKAINRQISLQLRLTHRAAQSLSGKAQITWGGATFERDFRIPRRYGAPAQYFLPNALVSAFMDEGAPAGGKEPPRSLIDQLIDFTFRFQPGRVASLAPIRTRPERTYSDAGAPFDPTGGHVPYLLARLLGGQGPKSQAESVVDALTRFGKESGLFDQVDIKKLGRKDTDPFQLVVQVAGAARERNLTDVGYGVSQALPVVVQTVLESHGHTLLMQQPEVHLHPRAQAALGTFFATAVAGTGRRLVIETHSDFILDRVRQEVAHGTIRAEDVGILFLDRHRYETSVHSLALDPFGNVLNAPPSYRTFFLREEINLLNRTGM